MEYQGALTAGKLSFGIVVSRFNGFLTEKLLAGARDCLIRHGAAEKNIDVVWVPGSFEIPLAARRMAAGGKYHAVICLGVILRGDTTHNQYVSAEVSRGIGRASADTGVPVAFGVVNADTLEQAIERSGTKANRGFEAALSAIEMANLLAKLPGPGKKTVRGARR